MVSTTFGRFAGASSLLAALSIFLYSVAFVLLRDNLLSGFFLLATGLLTLPLLVGLYGRLRVTEEHFALLALLLGIAGAIGSAVHGGYDLANAINPPAAIVPSTATLPSQVDPRGLLTFGVSGVAVFFFAWLIDRGHQLPRGLAFVGYLLALLLVVLYVGRLTVLDASSIAILGPALLAGFVVNPIWYAWLGISFLTAEEAGLAEQ
ncbi:MAG TPA: hypothetical protein VF960_15355 [Chloroflexota bacterium]